MMHPLKFSFLSRTMRQDRTNREGQGEREHFPFLSLSFVLPRLTPLSIVPSCEHGSQLSIYTSFSPLSIPSSLLAFCKLFGERRRTLRFFSHKAVDVESERAVGIIQCKLIVILGFLLSTVANAFRLVLSLLLCSTLVISLCSLCILDLIHTLIWLRIGCCGNQGGRPGCNPAAQQPGKK